MQVPPSAIGRYGHARPATNPVHERQFLRARSRAMLAELRGYFTERASVLHDPRAVDAAFESLVQTLERNLAD